MVQLTGCRLNAEIKTISKICLHKEKATQPLTQKKLQEMDLSKPNLVFESIYWENP
jgi:hypothetical protein